VTRARNYHRAFPFIVRRNSTRAMLENDATSRAARAYTRFLPLRPTPPPG
jgi:hypothetical protein